MPVLLGNRLFYLLSSGFQKFEELIQLRIAKVDVDQQSADADLRQGDGKITRHERYSNARSRRADRERATPLLDVLRHDVRPQCAVGLSRAAPMLCQGHERTRERERHPLL